MTTQRKKKETDLVVFPFPFSPFPNFPFSLLLESVHSSSLRNGSHEKSIRRRPFYFCLSVAAAAAVVVIGFTLDVTSHTKKGVVGKSPNQRGTSTVGLPTTLDFRMQA